MRGGEKKNQYKPTPIRIVVVPFSISCSRYFILILSGILCTLFSLSRNENDFFRVLCHHWQNHSVCLFSLSLSLEFYSKAAFAIIYARCFLSILYVWINDKFFSPTRSLSFSFCNASHSQSLARHVHKHIFIVLLPYTHTNKITTIQTKTNKNYRSKFIYSGNVFVSLYLPLARCVPRIQTRTHTYL